MDTVNYNIDYNFIQKLFDSGFDYGKGWKSHFFNNTQIVFEKHFNPLKKWKPNVTDMSKYGICDDNGKWSWMNRINTHPNCCLSFYKWCMENDSNFFNDFGNKNTHEENAKKMWNYLDNNFDLFFTDKITNKYFSELKFKCLKSWNSGNLSMIGIILSLQSSFGDVSDINFTFEYGDSEDMGGVDLSFKLPNGDIKRMQIKSGKFLNMREEFLIEGSQNSLTYKEDYYGYVNIDVNSSRTSVIIFENVKELYKDNKYIVVKSEFVKYQKIENMPIPEKLNEILIICGKNNVEFILTREDDKNNIKFDEDSKKLIVNFSDFEDKGIENMIDEKLKELKEFFDKVSSK
jgi:hypothetical protein